MSEIKIPARFNINTDEEINTSREGYWVKFSDYEILRAAYEALQKENAELKEDLQFVERWANHHGTKHNITAQEVLSCIQHYPSITEITKSYKDGVIPNTRNPYAELAAQAKRIEELENQISSQLNFGERMIIDSDGDVVGDDTGRVVAKFSHCNEAESFCEAANFKYSASKNGE